MTAKIERAAAVRWIQDRMADYDLTMEKLRAAGCFDRPPPTTAAGAGAARTPASAASAAAGGLLPQRRGPSWDGAGEMPDWLRRAVNAGQSAEFYRV